jgi:hypothetical protein
MTTTLCRCQTYERVADKGYKSVDMFQIGKRLLLQQWEARKSSSMANYLP